MNFHGKNHFQFIDTMFKNFFQVIEMPFTEKEKAFKHSTLNFELFQTVEIFLKHLICIINWPILLVRRVFANDLRDWGSIPGQVIPKTQKMVLDTSLLNIIAL